MKKFFFSLDTVLSYKERVLDGLKAEEEKKRAKVVEAKKESSSLDKLKEKQFEEYNKQVQKENEQMIEEFVSTQSAFARLNE